MQVSLVLCPLPCLVAAMPSHDLPAGRSDYCDICPEAHSCDKTCKLPCAGGDSGRRLSEIGPDGGWASSLAQQTSTCPLGMFESQLQEVNALCCVGKDAEDRACETGMPTTCPYRCGRVRHGAAHSWEDASYPLSIALEWNGSYLEFSPSVPLAEWQFHPRCGTDSSRTAPRCSRPSSTTSPRTTGFRRHV